MTDAVSVPTLHFLSAWVRSLFEPASAAHVLHCLNVSDDVCKARLHRHNAARSDGAEYMSDETFDAITAYFVPPHADEGFIVRASMR